MKHYNAEYDDAERIHNFYLVTQIRILLKKVWYPLLHSGYGY
jgi:hypothetical protein